MKILFFTRQGKKWSHRGGGIYRSGRAINKVLRNIDDEVIYKNINHPINFPIPTDIDLVWFYGDFEFVSEKISQIRKTHDVPFLINSTWDNTDQRANQMKNMITDYNSPKNDVFLAIFAPNSLHDPRLIDIKNRLIVIPKIFSYPSMRRKFNYKDRQGICIGEAAKLSRTVLNKLNVCKVLRRLHGAYPDIPIVSYQQYNNTVNLPEFVDVVQTTEKGFGKWLLQFRIFIAFTNYETFSMVPMEAQMASTPVFYPDMPQSLNHYINFSGYPYNNYEDLISSIGLVYNNEKRWTEMAKASYYNAKSKYGPQQAVQLHLELDKMVRRYQSQ